MISPQAIERWRHQQKELLLKLYNEAWAQGVDTYTPLSDADLEALAQEFEGLNTPPDFTGTAPAQPTVPPDAGVTADPLDVVDAVRKANMGDLAGGVSDLAKASAQDFAAFHIPAAVEQHAASIASAYARAVAQAPASAIAATHAAFIGNVHSAVVHTYSTSQNVGDVKDLARRAFDKLLKPTEPDSVQRAIALQGAYDGVDRMAAQLATLPPPVEADLAAVVDDNAAKLDTHGLLDFIEKNAWRLDAGDSVAWAGEQNGYAEAANADGQLLEWQTEGDDHVCPDCEQLGGFPPMPLSDWPSRPGDGSTECNVGCRCSLEAIPLSVVEGDIYTPQLSDPQESLMATINTRQAQSLADAMAHVDYLAESSAPREAITADLARMAEYSDSEPRDDHGKWTSGGGGDYASLVSDRASLITGNRTSVDEQNAPALIESLKDAPGPVELENLHVDGADHGNLFDHSATSIDRAHMPQVPGDAEHMAQFQQLLAERGLTYTVDRVSPLDLHATQDQLDGRTVGKIASAYDPNKAGLLVTADDGAILDGHHRWASGAVFAMQNPDYNVGELRVHTDINTLLKVGYEFDQRSGIRSEAFGHMHEAAGPVRVTYTRTADDPRAPNPAPPRTTGISKPFKVETPTEPCPDPTKPYIWLDGKWYLIATDAQDAPLREATWPLREYSDEEARDEHGRWTSGGGGADWQVAKDDNSADFTAVKYARSNFETPPQGMYSAGLTDYTNGWSKTINSDLRSGAPLGRHERDIVSSMDRLVGGSRVTADTTVFRGFSNDVTAEMQPGDTLIDHGFVSTTLREPVAERYLTGGRADAPVSGYENAALMAGTTPTLAEIHVPAGAQAYAQDHYETSGFAQVILPRDSAYQMVSSEMVGDGQSAYRRVVFDYQPDFRR